MKQQPDKQIEGQTIEQKWPVQILPLGDAAVLVQFKLADNGNADIYQLVQAFATHIEQHPFPGMIEFVPAFTSVAIYYDPITVKQVVNQRSDSTAYEIVVNKVHGMLAGHISQLESHSRVIEIPVCYGGEYGPDLEEVAKYHQLAPEEVIRIHSQAMYKVYMIGFAPGFPYLGGMSSEIATPRRASPRLQIPAGSVGIGGEQTGVYPIETPGGWQLIGRTPLALFRPKQNPPSYLQAGDTVRFRPITQQEYLEWGGEES
ncbi:5-oxoprolinase subunit PxpB [Brevibacillus laterosporus]|uniref:5-oxoprolinase subunit PxpB n=1 Tax=Brevibacillus laterosporus TaxID=1465 RepID=UPI00215BC339|nr:5-oxoprolinase subunit PxpB [Brevibacillus laterosporus]MCR8938455.1 5-oxoprolinase subunit PxpB [Brevibacillus laterosporus]MCZ0841095.1 5-oxoprolinase subunit PxpB [Brevibacillus laterosporus]MCZ0844939.1 5-oxoprolinase subunit PxpB [Brevibacillus laterosporus]